MNGVATPVACHRVLALPSTQSQDRTALGPEDDCPWVAVGGGGGGGGGGTGIGAPLEGGCFSKLLGVVLVLIVCAHLFVAFAPEPADVERRLVEVAVVLPGSVVDDLDRVAMDAGFASEGQRRDTLDALMDAVDPAEVDQGFVRVLVDPDRGGNVFVSSRRRYERQLRRADLGELTDVDLRTARAADPPSEAVVLGVIVSRPTSIGAPIQGDTWAARDFLWQTSTTTPEDGPVVLYFYYGPDPGDTLSEREARRVLADLT